MAAIVEGQLKVVDDVVGHTLPLQTIRLGPKTVKGIPRLTADPYPAQVEKAITLLTFVNDTVGQRPDRRLCLAQGQGD